MLNSRLFLRRCAYAVLSCVMAVTVSLVNAQTPSSPAPTPSPQGETPAPSPQGEVQPSPQTPSGQTGQTGQTGQNGAGSTQDESDLPSLVLNRTLDQPQVKELGGGGRWFTDNVDWLHWGPVGLRSAEAFYTYAMQDNTGTPGPGTSSNLSAATFQADIVYSQRLRRSRFIWQYSPRVLIVDGQFSRQLANQDSTFDVLFAPATRLTVGISDWFSFYGAQNTLNDRTIDRNNFSGYIINPFLNNGQQTLVNSVALPVIYSINARTTLSVSPFFNYGWVSSNGDASQATPPAQPLDITTMQYGARTQVSRTLSSRLSLGMYYTYQVNQETGTPTTTSYIQTFGGTGSRQLGRSLFLTGEFGASRSNESNTISWTGVGSVALTKAWRRSSLRIMYGRDFSFSGLVGNGYTQYGWANYARDFGRKASIGAGFGYLAGPSQGQPGNGKYATGTVSYALLRNLSWFVSYVSFWQSGNPVQFTPGHQSQYQSGLRWTAARKTGF